VKLEAKAPREKIAAVRRAALGVQHLLVFGRAGKDLKTLVVGRARGEEGPWGQRYGAAGSQAQAAHDGL
jgi:hypothetical protein